MNWRKIFLWSGCGFVLLLSLTVSALLTVDLGVFKPQIEQWVTDETGRQFSIDGELSVLLGSQSVVVADGVRLANASWSDEDLMLELGEVEVRLNVWSLLDGRVEVDLIRLDDAKLRLERIDGLKPNWEMITASPTVEEAPGDGTIDLLVRQIDVEQLHVVYLSPDRTGPLDLRVDRLNQRHRDDDYLELTLDGYIGDRRIEFVSEAGTWSALLEQKDFEYELRAQLDTLTIASKGHIDDLANPRKPILSFSANSPNVNDLARLLQVAEHGTGDIGLSGSLTASDDGGMILSIDGNMGQMQVESSGYFSDLQDFEQFDVSLDVSGPDAGQVLKFAGMTQLSGVAFELNLDAERRGPLVLIKDAHITMADAELDLSARLPTFPSLDNSNLRLAIVGEHAEQLREVINLPNGATGPYSLAFDLTVTEDGIEVMALDIESSLLKLKAGGRLADGPNYFGSEMQIDAEIKNLADMSKAYGFGSFSDRSITIEGSAILTEDGIRIRDPIDIDSNDVVASVNGLVALTPGIVGSDITFELGGTNLAALVEELASIDYIPTETYDFGGRLQIEKNHYRIQEFVGTLGRSSIEVEGLINLEEGLDGTEIRFKAEGPAIEELTSALEKPNFRPGAYALAAKLSMADGAITINDIDFSRDRGQLLGDVKLAFPESGLDADFDLQASGGDLQSVLGTIVGFKVGEAPFSVDVRGMLRGTRLALDELDVSVGEATINAQGGFDFSESSRSTQFSLSLNIPSLATIGSYHGRFMREQSLTINAKVDGGGGFLRIDDLAARLGDSDIRGSVIFEKGDVPKLDVTVQSDSVRFAPLMEVQELQYDPTPEFDDGRLIPDIAIPFDRMKALDTRIKIEIGELHRDRLHVRNLITDLELRDGELTLHDFSLQAPVGWLRARGPLGPAEGTGKATFAAVARDLSFGLSEFDSELNGRIDIDINLTSIGANTRSLAANLDGVMFMHSTNMIFPENRFMKRLYGDLLNEIVSTVNPFAKASTVHQIDCIVSPLEITKGNLATMPSALIINTSARMVVDTVVNLQSEKLNVQFQTTPRKGLTISAGEILNPYVKIVGTLAKPALAVDEQGVLITGGAAVATGGLSILAKAAWQRLAREKNPCEKAAEKSLEALSDRFPSFSPPIATTLN